MERSPPPNHKTKRTKMFLTSKIIKIMKITILKISVFVLLLSLMGAGCKKDEIQYADESIEISGEPGFSIYKTNGDYFNFVSVIVVSDEHLAAVPGYTLNDPSIKVDTNGKVSPNFRWRLKNGYIIAKGTDVNSVFTNITIQEYVDYNTAHGTGCWPDSLIRPRIIDRSPFTEFYHHDGLNKPSKTYMLGEINHLIESDSIETICTKLK
jgi:hypothetical protein